MINITKWHQYEQFKKLLEDECLNSYEYVYRVREYCEENDI